MVWNYCISFEYICNICKVAYDWMLNKKVDSNYGGIYQYDGECWHLALDLVRHIWRSYVDSLDIW